MKAAILAGLCAFSNFSPENNMTLERPKAMSVEFPKKVIVTEPLVMEGTELAVGAFNKFPTNLFELNAEALEASPQWLSQQVKAGGEKGFKALIQALRLSGISISANSDVLNAAPTRAQGITLPLWRLQMIAGGDHLFATHSLNSYAKSMSLIYTQTEAGKIEVALLKDFQSMIYSEDEGVQFFASFIDQLAFRKDDDKSYLLINAGSVEERAKAKLTTMQIALLGLRFEAEFAAKYLGQKSNLKIRAGGCNANPSDVVNDSTAVKKDNAFESLIKITEADSLDNPAQIKKSLARLNEFLKSHTGILRVLTADVVTELLGDNLLIRTKNTTAGERKSLRLTFSPSVRDREELNCLTEYAKGMGLIIKDRGNDFLDKVKARLTIEKSMDKKRIFFEKGTVANFSQSALLEINNQGQAEAAILGMPQARNLGKVSPMLVEVPVKVEVEIDILKYIEGDPTRSDDAVISALLEFQKNAEESKMRRKMFLVNVRDWVGAPEGSMTVKVNGHYAKTVSTRDGKHWNVRSTVADFASTAVLNLTEKSRMNPGWPEGMPIPPGFPPEYLSPSIQVEDKVLVYMLSEINNKDSTGGICDACKPESGDYDITKKFVENRHGIVMESEPFVMVGTPIYIDRKNKKLNTTMGIAVRDIKGNWEKSSSGNRCPDDTVYEPNTNGKIESPLEYIKTFELEVGYEEVDGVAVVKKTYLKDFTFPMGSTAARVELPSTVELKFDIRIPLP